MPLANSHPGQKLAGSIEWLGPENCGYPARKLFPWEFNVDT